MEVREFVENKRPLFTPVKVSPLVVFHVTSKGSEIQNLRAGHQSFYPHQARGIGIHADNFSAELRRSFGNQCIFKYGGGA